MNRMIDSLLPEQLEIAACTSYTYWFVVTTNVIHDKIGQPSPYYYKSETTTPMIDMSTARTNMASLEAYRHLLAEKKNIKRAMERFHNVLIQRQLHRYDLIRDCFYSIRKIY